MTNEQLAVLLREYTCALSKVFEDIQEKFETGVPTARQMEWWDKEREERTGSRFHPPHVLEEKQDRFEGRPTGDFVILADLRDLIQRMAAHSTLLVRRKS